MRQRRQRLRLKGLKRYQSGGEYYVYHRATGTRLPAELPEDHPEFLAAYLKAEKASPPQPRRRFGPGSLQAVWQAYLASDGFKLLSDSYRAVRRRDGEKLMSKGGHVTISEIKQKHVEADLSDLAPHAANERRKTWRAIMGFALERGLIERDPSVHVARRKTAKVEPHAPWTAEDINMFRDRWPNGTMQRLAFELLHWSGARMSDAVRLGPGMVDREGWLVFTQQKTGGEVSIPFSRTLPAFVNPDDLAKLHEAIAATPRHMTWIVTEYGHSRSQKAASQWFAAAARSAGVIGKTAHGLRKTRAVKLTEAGASTHQIGAWTGHESLKEIEHYSRGASRRRLLSGTEQEPKLSKAKGF